MALVCVALHAIHAQTLDVVYNGMSAPNYGYSSADPSTYYGAWVSVTRTGTLGSVGFSLYNGSSSGGTIVAGTMKMSIYDASQGTSGASTYLPLLGSFSNLPLLGSLSIPLNFSSAPLAAGYYTIYYTGDLSTQNISITSRVLVTQQFELTQGSATRFGIATSGTAPTTGSSTGHYFISNSQNPPGFYSGLDGSNAFPLYELAVVPEPEPYAAAAGLVLVGWSVWRRSRSSSIPS